MVENTGPCILHWHCTALALSYRSHQCTVLECSTADCTATFCWSQPWGPLLGPVPRWLGTSRLFNPPKSSTPGLEYQKGGRWFRGIGILGLVWITLRYYNLCRKEKAAIFYHSPCSILTPSCSGLGGEIISKDVRVSQWDIGLDRVLGF